MATSPTDDALAPNLARRALAVLRQYWPSPSLFGVGLVTRYADVREVLSNDRDFGVFATYPDRMARTTGNFILGMENTDQYRFEVELLRRCVKADDLGRIRDLVRSTALRRLGLTADSDGPSPAQVGTTGESTSLDVVYDFIRPIALELVASYFGVHAPLTPQERRSDETLSPGRAKMSYWMRIIFWDLFLNIWEDSQVSDAAVRASRELKEHLDGLIQTRGADLAANRAPDDFLTRLIVEAEAAHVEGADFVRRNIGGIIVGAVDTLTTATVQALDELLQRPLALASAIEAARRHDDKTLAAHVFEALRFQPHNPVIIRTCAKDTVIAQGTPRETRIRQGTRVFAVTLAAMFDPEVMPDPESFRTDRPLESYLHFGYGQHTCFGRRIAGVVVPEAIGHLLRLPNLSRGTGSDAQTTYQGPFPNRYVVKFTRGPVDVATDQSAASGPRAVTSP